MMNIRTHRILEKLASNLPVHTIEDLKTVICLFEYDDFRLLGVRKRDIASLLQWAGYYEFWKRINGKVKKCR